MHYDVAKSTSRAINSNSVNDFTAVKAKHEKKNPAKESNVVWGAILLITNDPENTITTNPSPNGRKISRGSTLRKKHANLENSHLIELFKSNIGELAAVQWVCQQSASPACEKCLGQCKLGWLRADRMK